MANRPTGPFARLTDMAYHRSTIQAIAFYVASSALAMAVTVVLAITLGLVLSALGIGNLDDRVDQLFPAVEWVGTVVMVVATVGLSFAILRRKRLLTRRRHVLVALSGGVLALAVSGLLGMIAPAFLSTRENTSVEGTDATE